MIFIVILNKIRSNNKYIYIYRVKYKYFKISKF